VFNQIKEKEDFKFALAFGTGFISVLFMGFVSGYAVGRFLMEWDQNSSLVLSLFFGVGTLFMEGFLMIFRLEKWMKKREMEKKVYKVE
jgi:putative Mn2+ efflux pump MntP